MRVDPVRHIANEGSVSVVNLSEGKGSKELLTGLHASGLAKSHTHRFVVCCNADSDHLSVIDTRTRRSRGDDLGEAERGRSAGRCARTPQLSTRAGVDCMSPTARRMPSPSSSSKPKSQSESRLVGNDPSWLVSGRGACGRCAGRRGCRQHQGAAAATEDGPKNGTPRGFNSHQYFGSLSLVPIPQADELPTLSERVARNLRAPRIAQALLPPRPNQPPRAIPERIGEPSLIKHVVYIIKENRTYDQVFGAFGRGNGDASLCVFGRRYHPEPSQDRRRVRAARQHLLLRHSQCRRPSVEHHGLLHRLHGKELRGFPAQLSGRHGGK